RRGAELRRHLDPRAAHGQREQHVRVRLPLQPGAELEAEAPDAPDAAARDQARGAAFERERARRLEEVVAVAVDAEEAHAEPQLLRDPYSERRAGVVGRAVLPRAERPLRGAVAAHRVEAGADLVLLEARREDAEPEREPRLELARERGRGGDRDELEVAAVVAVAGRRRDQPGLLGGAH